MNHFIPIVPNSLQQSLLGFSLVSLPSASRGGWAKSPLSCSVNSLNQEFRLKPLLFSYWTLFTYFFYNFILFKKNFNMFIGV